MLNILRNEIKILMKTEVKQILQSVRNLDNMIDGQIVADDKIDGTPVTQADIKIGKLFVNKLKEMLPESVVINEEDFNEEVYEEVKKAKYVWVVDPIDGTRAFCDINNKNYCVGIALLENMRPVLSIVYIPEYEIHGNTDFIIEAIETEDGVKINEKLYKIDRDAKISDIKYICNIQHHNEQSKVEAYISSKCCKTDIVKSNFGYSSLINYILVVTEGANMTFSKREVNIWDIVQSAYIVEKAGGKVVYENGEDVLPLDINKLVYRNNKLILPFAIAGNDEIKNMLKGVIQNG